MIMKKINALAVYDIIWKKIAKRLIATLVVP